MKSFQTRKKEIFTIATGLKESKMVVRLEAILTICWDPFSGSEAEDKKTPAQRK